MNVMCNKNDYISPANSFDLVRRPTKRYFIQIKNNDGPRMELWGTLALPLTNGEIKSSSYLIKSLLKVKFGR